MIKFNNYSGISVRIKYLLAVILLAIIAYTPVVAQLNGEYSIGAGGDFKNFTEAANELNKVGISGTVTFSVQSGIYIEQFTLGMIANSSPLKKSVIFQSETGNPEDVLLEFKADSKDSNFIVRLQGTQFIEFKNIAFSAKGLGRVFELDLAASNIAITGCTLSGIYNTNAIANAALIYSNGQGVENINITENHLSDCSYAIYLAGSFNYELQGIRINGNTFSNTGYTSVNLSIVKNPKVSGNIITGGLNGIIISNGDEGLDVSKNQISATMRGIRINYFQNQVTGMVVNNFITVQGVSEAYGLDLQNSSNINTYHNSVIIRSTNRSSRAFNCASSSSGTINVINNSFSCLNEGYSSYVNDPLTLNKSDFNNYYSASNMMFFRGENVYDLAALKNLGSQDQHSFSVWPGHISETDLHAFTRWIAHKGLALPEVTDDIDGDIRDTGNPDIGADEFSKGALFLPPFAGDVMVGPGQSYESLQDLFDVLKTRGISSDLFIRLLSGIHNEQAELVSIPGSGPDSRIHITRPAIIPATDSVVLRYNASGPDDNFLLRLTGADFINIHGITFHAENDVYSNIIELKGGADSIDISGNTFRSTPNTNNDERKTAIISNDGYYLNRLIENNTFNGGAYGILMRRISAYVDFSEGAHINGNIMNNIGYTGVYIQQNHSPEIISNTIHAGARGILLSGSSGSFRIEKNKLDIDSQYGIYLSGTEAYLASPGLIANNFIHVGGTGKAYGILVSSTDYLSIDYNSVNITSTNTSDGRALHCNSGTNIYLKNNIFANNGGGYAYYVMTASAIRGSDYNDLFTTGSTLAYWNGNHADLSSLQGANSYHHNCISADPEFVSESDLHTSAESLKGAAFPLLSFSDDIDGDLRHLSTPDIGADEFGGGSGSGLFTELELDLPGIKNGKSIWGDYDMDGDLDIVMSGNEFSKIYQNNGSGSFSDAGANILYVNNADIVWTDYNADNQPDLFLTGTSPTGLKAAVMYENESGTLTGKGIDDIEGFYYASSAWADFDNDGDYDLLITGITESGTGITKIYFREDGGFPFYNTSYDEMLVGENVKYGSVAVSDYDQDGDFDFALCGLSGSGTDRITRLYKNTNGEFQETDDEFTGVFSGTLAWGDYDGDGDMDLLVGGYGSSTTKLYENDEGKFYKTIHEFVGLINSDAAWADYDSDGDLDLLICGLDGSEQKTILYSNNNGESFTPVDAGLIGVHIGSVAWGDGDRDGDPDILLCGDADGTPVTKVFINNTISPGSAPQGPSNLQARVTDKNALLSWNRADDEDTPAPSLTYNLEIFRNFPTGNEEVVSPLALSNGTGFTVGPGNMEGNTQIMINGLAPGATYYWKVQTIDQSYRSSAFVSGGSFTTLDQIFSSVHDIRGQVTDGELDFGDYDNDGDLDFIICGMTDEGRITEIYNNNNGIFTKMEIDLPGFDQSDVEWGDYDNDGYLDFVICGRIDKSIDPIFQNDISSQATLLYHNNAGASFAPISAEFINIRKGVATWGDCDNDGDLDLLISGYALLANSSESSQSRIYINQGMGKFDALNTDIVGLKYVDGAWGDYDSDGDLDIILSGSNRYGNNCTRIYTNRGNNSFVSLEIELPGLKDGTASWIEYNNDGRPDICLTGREADRTYIFRNIGSGIFVDILANIPSVYNSSVDWGDYDNDGDLDLFLTGIAQSSSMFSNGEIITSIFRNEDGDFVDIGAELPPVYDGCGRWADWTGSGKLDLIVFGSYFDYVRTFQNNFLNVNTPPETPDYLAVSLDSEDLKLIWSAANDSETSRRALSYNLRIGTASGMADIKSPMSADDGYRKLVKKGNVDHVYSWTLKLDNFAEAIRNNDLYWSVQAIDNGYMGSEFAPEDTLDLSGLLYPAVDVSFDQGGKVTLNWRASDLDHNTAFLTYYSIWRSIPGNKKSTGYLRNINALTLMNTEPLTRITRSKGEDVYWEWVANQPAHKLPLYAYTCSTVNDSMSGYDGIHHFMISAHTTNPDVYFDSEPVSGYSVDNLAPMAPMSLASAKKGNDIELTWTPNSEVDLKQYLVFRSESPEIDPAGMEACGIVKENTYTDDCLTDENSTYYYIVCAEDVHGNISLPSNEVMAIQTGTISRELLIPMSYTLYPVYPNPFMDDVQLTFDLPEENKVSLEIYNMLGEKVELLLQQNLPAGSYSFNWKPAEFLPAGTYVCILKAGAYNGKVLMIKEK